MSKLTDEILKISKTDGMDGFSSPIEYFYDFLEQDILGKTTSPKVEFVRDEIKSLSGRVLGVDLTCEYTVRYFKYLGELHSIEIEPNSWDDGGSLRCNFWTLEEVK